MLGGGGAAVHPRSVSSVISCASISVVRVHPMDGHVATRFRGFLLDSHKIWGLEVKALALPFIRRTRHEPEKMMRAAVELAGMGVGLLAPELNGHTG